VYQPENFKTVIIKLAILIKVLKLIPNSFIRWVSQMKSIKIKGMSCQHCVMAVTKALAALDGVKDVNVDLKSGVATYEEVKAVDPKMVAAAVKKAGYEIVE
jgi:copper chaperone